MAKPKTYQVNETTTVLFEGLAYVVSKDGFDAVYDEFGGDVCGGEMSKRDALRATLDKLKAGGAVYARGRCPLCGGEEVLELRVQADQKILVDCVCRARSARELAAEAFRAGYQRCQEDAKADRLCVDRRA